ncbi:MAG: pantoate--beta-alanine ligase [Rhodospirillales bacterium]|nr:pantoate--beta-alanine ligase [Rhodospirillales bacterium]
MKTVRTIAELREHVRGWRKQDKTVGLVPTMGGLHAGHVSLVEQSRTCTDRTIATLFVNPTQFAPHEDFATYPRTEEDDRQMLEQAGTDLLFAPNVSEIYPDGHSTRVEVQSLSHILEGEFRPDFFTGVATVVTKLLLQALPDVAIFGEKDYQQLCVIKTLARDLDIPVRIIGGATVREADGLAMSSRNQYLTAEEREIAPVLFEAITQVAEKVRDGGSAADLRTWAEAKLTKAGFGAVDYVAVRDAQTLGPVRDASRPARVLAAAYLGRARLIDNVAV